MSFLYCHKELHMMVQLVHVKFLPYSYTLIICHKSTGHFHIVIKHRASHMIVHLVHLVHVKLSNTCHIIICTNLWLVIADIISYLVSNHVENFKIQLNIPGVRCRSSTGLVSWSSTRHLNTLSVKLFIYLLF